MLTTITNAYPCCTLARSRARVLTRVARGAARTLGALNAPYFFLFDDLCGLAGVFDASRAAQ